MWSKKYHFTMRITIDKAGRVVIPKPMRERYHMYPGTELEIESAAEGVLIKAHGQEASLIHKQGVLVHHGSGTVDIDTAEYINKARDKRDWDIAAENSGE